MREKLSYKTIGRPLTLTPDQARECTIKITTSKPWISTEKLWARWESAQWNTAHHSLLFMFYTSLEGFTKKLVSYSPNVLTNTTVVFFSGNNTIEYWQIPIDTWMTNQRREAMCDLSQHVARKSLMLRACVECHSWYVGHTHEAGCLPPDQMTLHTCMEHQRHRTDFWATCWLKSLANNMQVSLWNILG